MNESHSVASELSVTVMQTSSADHVYKETDELCELRHELFKEGDRNNLSLIFGDSVCKELHTINEASLEKLDSPEQLSSCATLQKNNYSSLMINSLTERSNLTAHNEKLEEGRPLGYYSQVFSASRTQETGEG